MTNRQPHIPDEHRDHYHKSSFVNEPAEKPTVAPKPKAKPAAKKPVKKTK